MGSNLTGSAWTYNAKRNQCYLHQFAETQPDLNLRNPLVRQEFKDIVEFWLAKGVGGFRLDSVPYLYEDDQFRDNPAGSLVYTLREVLDANEPDEPRILLTDVDNLPAEDLVKYYGTESNRLVDVPINVDLLKEPQPLNALSLKNTIEKFTNDLPSWAWPSWAISSADHSRVATRLGDKLVDALAMVQMLLPGTPVILYGEEIGMEDPVLSPMQWSNSSNGGFSHGSSSIPPINTNYPEINVERQRADPTSHFNVYRSLVAIRKQNSILYGDTVFHVAQEQPDVLFFTRYQHFIVEIVESFKLNDCDSCFAASVKDLRAI